MPSSSPQAQSPPFGYLSPPTDSSDACSEDGDTLQTPLHDHQQLPYPAMYHHPSDVFSTSSFHGFEDGTNDHPSFSSLLTPSATEKLSTAHHESVSGLYFSESPPSSALELSTNTLEFDPFAASFGTFNDTRVPSYGPPSSSASHELPPLPSLSLPPHPDSPPPHGLMLHDTDCDSRPSFSRSPHSENTHMLKARMFNPRFPSDHILNSFFARNYLLGDELGAGGYGFVMTARHRLLGHEVAVKFIIKEKVPEHAWWDDEILGRVPTEVMVMSLVNHENIVRCLDLFEDERYFYLVQELHGTPWVAKKSKKTKPKQISAPGKLIVPSPVLSTPSLTPSPSIDSNLESESLPGTPPQVCIEDVDSPIVGPPPGLPPPMYDGDGLHPQKNKLHPHSASSCLPSSSSSHSSSLSSLSTSSLTSTPPSDDRPTFSRRASYDLFECIEQSKNKRLEEGVARYVFAQVVEAVYYLSEMGITHCDIKDENLVVDAEFKVKLIDFGSALISYPPPPSPSSPSSPSHTHTHTHPHPQEEYHTLFFGTTAYAASEILLKQPYRAAPAEIWTLGVLLSYLVTGHSPFETERDAVEGRVRGWDVWDGEGEWDGESGSGSKGEKGEKGEGGKGDKREQGVSGSGSGSSGNKNGNGRGGKISRAAVELMKRCLEKDPCKRADIEEVRVHRWLRGALDRGWRG